MVTTAAYAAIRECRESDLARFHELGSALHVRHCRVEFARMQRGEALILVAVDEDDHPVAKLHIDFVRTADEGAGWILSAATSPARQRRGIGTALVREAEKRIAERGLEYADIGVEDDNPRARRLYERLGYREIGRERFSYEVEGPDGKPTPVSNNGARLRRRIEATPLATDDVWEALAEIPDPEIPVISLVDLGVIKDVEVEDGRVRIDFTPTFMGCPALEAMKHAMERKIAELGGEPEVNVVLDDSWSSDRISAEGREKLRAAGFAPPSPRPVGKLDLVQLQRGTFRCPYCGSTETRLENLFGPTPCRSIRYCASCRQPFEQFKTL